ncbi:MAG: type II toxin-antitoxin system VapC family toxin [Phormidesmis sp. CAN_BIN36]|nr:type II toxin-antitoxin system VapC family toxin [Phormidesmis sp. CAN_BIN36]
MDIIIDANLLVALVTQHPQRQTVYQQFERWASQDAALHAPDLAYSEVTSALTRMVAAGLFEREKSQAVCEELTALPIQYHTVGFNPEVVVRALELGRKSAYDAVYLVLAQRLDADLWTLDSPLYRNAVGRGHPVYLLENSEGL